MLRRLLLVCCLSLLAAPAGATWSILVVDRATGEVAVAGATCLPFTNLTRTIPTLVPGVGAGVIQASGNNDDLVPLTMGLNQGLDPADILELVLAAEPSPRSLQAGIVCFYPGAPLTYSGTGVKRAKLGVTGEIGSLAYAIQGNVLAGNVVVTAAEQALLNTPGDLGQRLLAAMQAARAQGGDGRCSCDEFNPTACGAPPPNFTKSAHIAFLLVARIGDEPSPCLNGGDCAQANSHLRLSIFGQDGAPSAPDPVDQLSARYVAWRAARAGRPDALRSVVESVDSLPADGLTQRTVTVRLVDIDGVPLDHGGARVSVASADGARLHARLGPVRDLGDGRYQFALSATRSPGLDRLAITAQDELVSATLYPFPEVRSVEPPALHAGVARLSAATGGSVPFVLALPQMAGGTYRILARADGGPSGLVGALLRLPGGTLRGTLDAHGRAEALLAAAPGELRVLTGRTLSCTAVVTTGARRTLTDTVRIAVEP